MYAFLDKIICVLDNQCVNFLGEKMSLIGTVGRGIKAPIFREGDNLPEMVVDCVINASQNENFELNNKDIVGVTEAVLARTQGNYATIEQIAKAVNQIFGNEEVGLVFPILSRNRFLPILKAISKGVKKLYVMLSYPSDEVGNPLITIEQLKQSKLNPYTDVLTEVEFRKIFPKLSHPFTGVDYIKLYKEATDNTCEIILGNKAEEILKYTDKIICGDIHTRHKTKKELLDAGAKNVVSLDEILTNSVDGSGYNDKYGLLGSNLATDDSVKLFPRDCQNFVLEVQKIFKKRTGKDIEVLVYGDGAFKDPVGGIWELADPVVAPAFTQGLRGTPNEIKLKYIADNNLTDLSEEEAEEKMKQIIKNKQDIKDSNVTLGTTPRQFSDLIGSLCDLLSGSGDKGTPIVLIQGYFDNYAS